MINQIDKIVAAATPIYFSYQPWIVAKVRAYVVR